MSDAVYLEKTTIRHAHFGGIGGDTAEIVVTRDAWERMGEPTAFVVNLKGFFYE